MIQLTDCFLQQLKLFKRQNAFKNKYSFPVPSYVTLELQIMEDMSRLLINGLHKGHPETRLHFNALNTMITCAFTCGFFR